MLDTIVSWFIGAIGEALQWVVKELYGQLELSLSRIYNNFAPLATAYNILQACAIGLILAFSAWNLFKFFGGSLTKVHETPIMILVRAFFAAMLVFVGGYFVSMVVDIAAVPYKEFMGIDAIRAGGGTSFSLTFTATGLVGSSAAFLIDLVLMILIAWNVLKLVVEIVERYLMVAVLAYTAPIFYPFLCSSSSTPIFMKWVGMFLGQCALMSVSVMFTTLVLACFSPSGGDDGMLRLIFGLAMCKVAQRADTYMQQLGIGVATTGENLIDDVVAFGHQLGRSRFAGGGDGGGDAGGGNSRRSILGTAAGLGGVVGFGANAIKNFQEGKTVKDSVASAAKTAAKNSVPGMKTYQRHKAAVAQRAVEAQKTFKDRADYWKKTHGGAGKNNAPADKDYAKMAQEVGMTAQQYALYQHNLNGSGSAKAAAPGDKKPKPGDQSADFELNKAAQSVGLSLGSVKYPGGRQTDGDESVHDARVIRGPDNMVADHIRENYGVVQDGLKDEQGNVDAIATDDYNETMADTLTYGPSIVAEDVLFGSDKSLHGNDMLGAAAVHSAFGDNLRMDAVNGQDGELKDIKVETAPIKRAGDGTIISGGGRVLTGSYTAPVRKANGEVVQSGGKMKTRQETLTIMDEVAYTQLDKTAQQKMEMIQSKSGGVYYVQRAEVTHSKVREQFDAVNSRVRGGRARKKKPE